MKKRAVVELVLAGFLLAGTMGCAEELPPAKGQECAEIEVARAEETKQVCQFKRNKENGEYSFYAGSWQGKLPKTMGQMSSDQAAKFVLTFVGDNFIYDRNSLGSVKAVPLTIVDGAGPARRCGWFIDILQEYKGATFGHVRGSTKREGGIHAMLNDPPDDPEMKTHGPSVNIDVILWRVVREHGKAKAIVTEKHVKDVLLKDFLAKYQYADSRKAAFTYLDLAYLPKQDDPNRWVPRWLAELSVPHPGPYTPSNPMKPTIHSYVVDAWTGNILESQKQEVPVAGVDTATTPLPPEEKSKNREGRVK
jgi:hypothetical protein